MIRKTIPVLVHEDCMDGIKTGLADQQASISKISRTTELVSGTLNTIENSLDGIGYDLRQIDTNTSSIRTSSSNTATHLGTIKKNTAALTSSVGLTADEASANTVIGLLKGISNKITTF